MVKHDCMYCESKKKAWMCLKKHSEGSFSVDDTSLFDDTANDLIMAPQLIYEMFPAVNEE